MTTEPDPKSGKKLLAKARRAGLIVYQQGPELMMEGPTAALARLKETLHDAKDDLNAALAEEADASNGVGTCGKCGRASGYLVPAYWSPAIRLCSPCCWKIAQEFDAKDAWPKADWGDLPVEGEVP